MARSSFHVLSLVCFVFQFIPDFIRHAKKRIKELDAELRVMPRAFADDNERWIAFREVLSHVRDELKDLLSIGNDGKVSGEDLHIVPHVTNIYRAYANGILEVSPTRTARTSIIRTGNTMASILLYFMAMAMVWVLLV